MQVSRYVLNVIHKLLPSPLSNLFTASRTVHEYSTRHCTAMKLQTPPTLTVVTTQCITKKGPEIWNYFSTEIYTNTAHQTLIHVSGLSSRLRRSVIQEYSD